jgi:hypothetical protein
MDSNSSVFQELRQLVQSANGLMPQSVYEEIWKVARTAKGPNFVEVGTAHGAATIALALGAKSGGVNVHIHTIDKMAGKFSSRARFGSTEVNYGIAVRNFENAGVADSIQLFIGSTDEFIATDQCPKSIDLLMLDADGRIDRDLMHFYSRMTPDSLLIIDDIDPNVYFGKSHENIPYIDLKHLITSLLLNIYETEGFIRVDNRIENTAFCKRGERDYDAYQFSQLALVCYRELVKIVPVDKNNEFFDVSKMKLTNR